MSGNSLLRLPNVQEKVPFGRTKIYDMVARGQFPRPLKIDGCTVWVATEIDEWVRQRIAEGRSAGGEG